MKLEIKKDKLELGGKDFYLAGGDIHYYRMLPGAWKRRLFLAKDFGLTAVQTYVPWNLHEPKKGEFNFEGHLNLGAFLSLCAEMDLKVMLRPTPYITSEMDMGGIPAWVVKDADTRVRCSDPVYLAEIASYYKRLCKEFVPYLSTNGGPVIAVAIENEYGSYSCDKEYLNFLRDTLTENGVDVPFYTTDGANIRSFESGKTEGAWSMVNCGENTEKALTTLREFQPDKPLAIGEFWAGGLDAWGSPHIPRDMSLLAEGYKKALDMGAYVNFYMFSGGTNFGFSNGMHYGLPFGNTKEDGLRLFAYPTSYDLQSPVNECGDTTPLYYDCRRILDAYLGKEVREDKIPDVPKQKIEKVRLTSMVRLFDTLDDVTEKKVETVTLPTMENLEQGFGYILYSTHVAGCVAEPEFILNIDGLHDLALIFADGKYIGSYLRDEGASEVGTLTVKVPKEGFRLDILVENMGRPDAGRYINERKGIVGGVSIHGVHPFHWETRTLPMKDISSLKMGEVKKAEGPVFYRGSFRAEAGVDTFLDTEGLTKGVVWINGFNIGRYWDLGPGGTLYVPGELLKEENEIVIFEMFEAKDMVSFTDAPIFVEPKKGHRFYDRIQKMQ